MDHCEKLLYIRKNPEPVLILFNDIYISKILIMFYFQ